VKSWPVFNLKKLKALEERSPEGPIEGRKVKRL
jgi:hypothetical protein